MCFRIILTSSLVLTTFYQLTFYPLVEVDHLPTLGYRTPYPMAPSAPLFLASSPLSRRTRRKQQRQRKRYCERQQKNASSWVQHRERSPDLERQDWLNPISAATTKSALPPTCPQAINFAPEMRQEIIEPSKSSKAGFRHRF